MKKNCLVLLAALLSVSFCASAQEDLSEEVAYQPIPWKKAITVGAAIWPTSKERFRLGYHWQPSAQKEWVHELSYIEAIRLSWGERFGEERYGVLRGGQLKNEIRFYHKKRGDGPAYWYHGVGLAYMYTRHDYRTGFDCEEWGGCAFVRQYNDLATHTNTLTGNFGLMLLTNGFINFNFYTNLGLRANYFPKIYSAGYFSRGPFLMKSDHFLLLPYVRLGASLMFNISKRKD